MHSQETFLRSIEVDPETSPIGTVILLHGLGANGNDFVPMLKELSSTSHLPLRFVFPNAPLKPITINNGYVMPAWYDITSMNINQRTDQVGISASVAQVIQLIEREVSRGIPTEKIVLAGFSQGAVIALTTGLQFPKRLGGIMALSGYFPFATEVIANVSDANRIVPIFFAHGTEDSIVPYSVGLEGFEALKKAGIAAEWHSYRMAHSVCEKEILDIDKWLLSVFE